MLYQKTKALLDGNLVDAETINLKLHAFSGSARYPTAIQHSPYLDDNCLVCHKFFHGDRRHSEIESCFRAGHFDFMSYTTIENKEYRLPAGELRNLQPRRFGGFCNYCIGTVNHSRWCPTWG